MPGPNDRSHEVQGRLQTRRAAHKARVEEQSKEVDAIKHSYARIKDEPAFRDLLAKAKSFAAYHTKMAKDGVGYRDTGEFDAKGKPVQEIVYYDQAKRLSELDKASGIEELEGYVLRQLTESAKVEVQEAAEAETDDVSTEDEPTPPAPVA
jgi:hypothetical protein